MYALFVAMSTTKNWVHLRLISQLAPPGMKFPKTLFAPCAVLAKTSLKSSNYKKEQQ